MFEEPVEVLTRVHNEGKIKSSNTVKITTFTKEKIGLQESKMYKNCNGNGMQGTTIDFFTNLLSMCTEKCADYISE